LDNATEVPNTHVLSTDVQWGATSEHSLYTGPRLILLSELCESCESSLPSIVSGSGLEPRPGRGRAAAEMRADCAILLQSPMGEIAKDNNTDMGCRARIL
jgi:hypothetical protein